MVTLHLTEQKCVACEGGVPPLSALEAAALLPEVPGWELDAASTQLSRTYTWKNFAEALAFVNQVGAVAESEGHHPDIHLVNFKQVQIVLTTHAIAGLSQNDFIVAAKIDALPG